MFDKFFIYNTLTALVLRSCLWESQQGEFAVLIKRFFFWFPLLEEKKKGKKSNEHLYGKPNNVTIIVANAVN